MMTSSDNPLKLVIDTDPGIDDAQAIVMALSCPQADVLAFTTCHGNVAVDQTTKNLLRLLKVVDKLHIPVYRGIDKPLLGDAITATHYHGVDGFGDVPDPDAPGLDLLQAEHAVTALLRLANQHPGEIRLICLAPLTNIAVALKIDPNFGKKLKECFIMGGNYQGRGNMTPSGEFNFLSDPEAAHIVLRQLQCPITLVGWELCLKHAIPAESYTQYINTPTPVGLFLYLIEKNAIDAYYSGHPGEYLVCDQLAVVCALDSRIVKDSKLVYCDVELHGSLTRSQVVVDWTGLAKHEPNVRVVTEIDMELYKQHWMTSVNDGFVHGH